MLWKVIVGAGVGVFSIYLAGFKIVAQRCRSRDTPGALRKALIWPWHLYAVAFV